MSSDGSPDSRSLEVSIQNVICQCPRQLSFEWTCLLIARLINCWFGCYGALMSCPRSSLRLRKYSSRPTRLQSWTNSQRTFPFEKQDSDFLNCLRMCHDKWKLLDGLDFIAHNVVRWETRFLWLNYLEQLWDVGLSFLSGDPLSPPAVPSPSGRM